MAITRRVARARLYVATTCGRYGSAHLKIPQVALRVLSLPRTPRHVARPDDRLVALNLRSLADLCAPSSLVVADKQLVANRQYTRPLAIAHLPPGGRSRMGERRVCREAAVDLSLHVLCMVLEPPLSRCPDHTGKKVGRSRRDAAE